LRAMPGRTRFTFIALVLSCTAACGGGGSGGGSAPPAANVSPTPAYTVTPTSGAAPLSVTFDATSSNDPDGTIATYAWHFGDDSPDAVGSRATHVYSASGNFTAQLTVTDNRGAVATRSADIEVTPASGTFTLSGKIQILPSSAVDSDVNDPAAPLTRNDTFAEAQQLPNPVSLGGYLNEPGAGRSGALHDGGDVTDKYEINFAGNENILLTVSNPDVDVSMLLLDSTQTVVDATVVSGGSGSLAAPTPGDYFVELDIQNGATTYVLNVGQNVPTTIRSLPARASDEFVPGEFIVRGADPQIAEAGRVAGRASGALFRLKSTKPNAIFKVDGVRNGARVSTRVASKYDTLAAIARASRQSAVVSAEPNYIRHATRVPNDPFYVYQWHYPSINLPLAWDTTQGSDQVIVAVIDTGVLTEHPDLQGQFVPGFDFIRDPDRARDGDGIDPDPTDPGDLGFGGSSTFHGTHVAGTIAAHSDNGDGVAGIAWHSKIMPLRALGFGGGTSYDLIQCVRFAAGLPNDSNTLPARRADIINLSLGSNASSQAEQTAFDQARAAGVIVIAAAGNDASTNAFFPAAYNGVVSVAATTITRTRAPYSNHGPSIDVAAPGGNSATDVNGDGIGDGIVSTIGDDTNGPVTFGYAALTGTSMASPHVAGVVALMKAVYPNLTPQQFDDALSAGQLTDDVGAPGRDDDFGFGLINAQKAVNTALSLASGAGIAVDPVLVASPSTVNFGAFDTMFDVDVRNAGGGSVAVNAVTPNQPWLNAAPLAVDQNGLGTYRITVDRTAAASDGTFTGAVSFESSANPADVNVVMQKFGVSPNANAGLHYVLLIDDVTNLVVHSDIVSATNGEYDYEFHNVGAGQYRIFAGSDSDNDNRICDPGEACGAFRTLDAPEVLTINGDRDHLDFISGFPVNLFNLDNSTSQHIDGFDRPAPVPTQPGAP
jgi:serine protease